MIGQITVVCKKHTFLKLFIQQCYQTISKPYQNHAKPLFWFSPANQTPTKPSPFTVKNTTLAMSVSKTYSKMIGRITVVCKKQTFLKVFIQNCYKTIPKPYQNHAKPLFSMIFNFLHIYIYIYIHTYIYIYT